MIEELCLTNLGIFDFSSLFVVTDFDYQIMSLTFLEHLISDLDHREEKSGNKPCPIHNGSKPYKSRTLVEMKHQTMYVQTNQ